MNNGPIEVTIRLLHGHCDLRTTARVPMKGVNPCEPSGQDGCALLVSNDVAYRTMPGQDL